MTVENMTIPLCSLFVFESRAVTMRPNELHQQAETVSERKGEGVTEVNWTIACGSEIKQDAGLWRLAQISPADLETKRSSLVLNLDERTSAYFADFCSRPHGNLSSSPE
jgi:hypothetical protein